MKSRREWVLYLAVVLVTCIFTYFALQLWNADLSVPFVYFGDALSTGAHFKTVMETGWYEFQPMLGSPYGQTFNDFPTADNLHMMVIDILRLFTNDWAVGINSYYLIGFPLIAVSALWFLRYLGISRLVAISLSVVYAIAPYHFIRSEGHLWLASYYVVPLSLAVVVMAIRGEQLWGRRSTGRPVVAWLTGPAARTVVIAFLTGTAQSYYAVFFLILLAFGGITRLIRSGEWKRFWGAAIAGLATVVVMLANMAPDIIYSKLNGVNVGALERGHVDSEIYALKLSQLLLPWPGHRIDALRAIRTLYDQTYPLPSEQPALGAIGAAGLVALFLFLAYWATTLGRRKFTSTLADSRMTTLGYLAALTFVAFLFSMIGGLSTIISFVTTSLRGWNRMSIVIALLCLAAVGVLLDMFTGWIVRRRNLRETGASILAITVSAALLVVAYVDQTPYNAASTYGPISQAYKADATWISQIDAKMPKSALILQLPYLPFPEYISPTGVISSDTLIPFLHSDDLRWTGGGIKGRPRADWPGVLGQLPGDQIVRLAAASGIDGIYIDRVALGDPAADLEGQITTETGEPPMVSANGRYAFFDITALRSQTEAEHSASDLKAVEERVTNPITTSTDVSFGAGIGDDGKPILIGRDSRPKVQLINDGKPIDSLLNLTVAVPPGTSDAKSITVTLPDGTAIDVQLTDGVGSFGRTVHFPAGASSLGLQVTGSDVTSTVPVKILAMHITDPTIAKFLSE